MERFQPLIFTNKFNTLKQKKRVGLDPLKQFVSKRTKTGRSQAPRFTFGAVRRYAKLDLKGTGVIFSKNRFRQGLVLSEKERILFSCQSF